MRPNDVRQKLIMQKKMTAAINWFLEEGASRRDALVVRTRLWRELNGNELLIFGIKLLLES